MIQNSSYIRRNMLFLFYLESGGQYAYVAVPGDEIGSFRRACNTPGADIAQHAEVLAKGSGVPDEATRKRMREYGFKH